MMTDDPAPPNRPRDLTTYFNDACPVCSAEIGHYRDEAETYNAPMGWVDVSTHPDALADRGVTADMAYRRLYAVDANGRLLVGLDAFIAIWRRLPRRRWHVLAAVVSLPIVRPVLSWGYEHIAARAIYTWNKRRLGRAAGKSATPER